MMLYGLSTQIASRGGSYHLGVCSGAAELPQGQCKDAAVCLVSSSVNASFGHLKEMAMDYNHQDEAVILQYKGGDRCPPGKPL